MLNHAMRHKVWIKKWNVGVASRVFVACQYASGTHMIHSMLALMMQGYCEELMQMFRIIYSKLLIIFIPSYVYI